MVSSISIFLIRVCSTVNMCIPLYYVLTLSGGGDLEVPTSPKNKAIFSYLFFIIAIRKFEY